MPHRLLARVILLFICCDAQAQTHSATPAPPPISYVKDIQPILNQKCVACQACNDAPSQLNLASGEGVSPG
ncbi:hypothetical protein RA272_30945, partial [Pseudomonas syringae pv. tagetis]|uniref:hypothetical protein n=1 Tax=Pseudomonas syringae group genomosp. 7 TaxID=251699 RepID=UPI00376F48E2